MQFGDELKSAIYQPWKEQYLDYSKLKSLLRENENDKKPWTEDDESRFSDEMFNVQIEKVTAFQESTFKSLEQRATDIGDKLRDLAPEDGKILGDITKAQFKEIVTELDTLSEETNELKKYSSINYTGFLKIVKKHDRKRGRDYKLRPMLQISLAKRPFNSEAAYIPLLNKLSTFYFVCRQNLDEESTSPSVADSEARSEARGSDKYTAYKFWIHPDNLVEVRTYISRRLPVLIYSDSTAKQEDVPQGDPTITSVYFDNHDFLLYGTKVDQKTSASSVRIRWDGALKDKQTLALEKKVVTNNGSSEESRINIKQKYIQAFIKGDYKMEKSVEKLERKQMPKSKVEDFKSTSEDIQKFILSNDLQPVLRANYTRSAYQKPLDDRVRVSIDTNLVFVREDSLDTERPCRNPDDWHRGDIDSAKFEDRFANINKGEISRFPFAVLEIKVMDDGSRKAPQWIQDLMASHLVHRAPKFSKFVHGVASLFEDYVNNLPFWLSELETDIRQDPHAAFEAEEKAKAQRAADDAQVGSLLGTSAAKRMSQSYKVGISSPHAKSFMGERLAAEQNGKSKRKSQLSESNGINSNVQDVEEEAPQSTYGTIASMLPSFSLSRYAQSRRSANVQLPPGVTKPGLLIKDSGPLHVEPKVWLANERTFLKWQHICILLGGLAVGLYTAAGEDRIAEFMGIAYIVIAIFAGLWGYYMHWTRRNMIVARSGKDFDNLIGPMVVSAALMVSLILNFIFKYRAAIDRFRQEDLALEMLRTNESNFMTELLR